jgi:hypothetical protein
MRRRSSFWSSDALRLAAAGWTAVLVLAAGCGRRPPVPFSAENDSGERWGYRNAAGDTVIAPVYFAAEPFSDRGIAEVADDSGWACIDVSGKVLVRPFVFDNGPDPFSEDLARFVRDGKMGFFDRAGKEAIAPRFDFALPFSEGFAAVCMGCGEKTDGEHRIVLGGTWGYIDAKGTSVIAFGFDRAESFDRGSALVEKDGRSFRIDPKGVRIGPPVPEQPADRLKTGRSL